MSSCSSVSTDFFTKPPSAVNHTTTGDMATWVERREHTISELEGLQIGTKAWRLNTFRQQAGDHGGSSCPAPTAMICSSRTPDGHRCRAADGELPQNWSGCPSAMVVDGDHTADILLPYEAAPESPSRQTPNEQNMALVPFFPSPPWPAGRSRTVGTPLKQEMATNTLSARHVAAVSSLLATTAGRTKRQHHLQEPEHNTDLIDGVASSYTSRHTKEGDEEDSHQQPPDLAEKIRQFPPGIEPKTGTRPNNSTTNPSIYTTRSGTSPQSFPASIAGEKDLGSARLTRFSSQEL